MCDQDDFELPLEVHTRYHLWNGLNEKVTDDKDPAAVRNIAVAMHETHQFLTAALFKMQPGQLDEVEPQQERLRAVSRVTIVDAMDM